MAKAKVSKEDRAEQIAKLVGAGKVVAAETVDFSDPNRPKTCLEVDFPIIPVNQIAQIEGNAGKPIYQMSKWWARRRSSVFRSLLLSAAMKAPEDESKADKAVWDVFYANHQKKGSFKNLKVADIFMGGGTTIVEGSRLGMQMTGIDLNPVAWFVVKNEMAKVDKSRIESLLSDIEKELKPIFMPYYACDCPRGHKGIWTDTRTSKIMPSGFDPLSVPFDERKNYSYSGPEVIYTFWAKHGPCSRHGCGHRTPIMSSHEIAVKEISVKAFDFECTKCEKHFDVEDGDARMAPGSPLIVSDDEKPFSIMKKEGGSNFADCPHCKHRMRVDLRKGTSKKVSLHLLIHPSWLKGSPNQIGGSKLGGSCNSTIEETILWNTEREKSLRLIEFRGIDLPKTLRTPDTNEEFNPNVGTVPKKSNFACSECGTLQDVLTSIRATGDTGPIAMYAIQGFCPECSSTGECYNGRFFSNPTHQLFDRAASDWEKLAQNELKDMHPSSELPFGFMTHMNNGGIPNHGFTHWRKMFNSRQLLVNAKLLKSILQLGDSRCSWEEREFVLGAFQQYLRNNNMFCFWDISRDCLAPLMSNNNYHPKATCIENGVFSKLGRGNWASCIAGLGESAEFALNPWDTVAKPAIEAKDKALAAAVSGKSEKVLCGDPVQPAKQLICGSSSDLSEISSKSFDLVITDPPFGGLLHYSELSDFFYVWLRLALKDKYPKHFGADFVPKSQEAVANRARNPDDPDSFYRMVLTQCWKESARILKDGGIMAFTFHHSEDEPWVDVLESLFESGFYLETTYPIRSDETKGEGAKPGTFGSQKIEFDIIHVCRKRLEEPKEISWGRLRRQILNDVRQLQWQLERHKNEGLGDADLKVIKRGKALEYYSKHYGKVKKSDDEVISVREVLIGINQIIDEESSGPGVHPPAVCDPDTQQLFRMFKKSRSLDRDQMQKYLRGTGTDTSYFVNKGWCTEKSKVFTLTEPPDFVERWKGLHKNKLTSDYDQAMVLMGACYPGVQIRISDTLSSEQFKPHPALERLLEWISNTEGQAAQIGAARAALQIFNEWKQKRQKPATIGMFADYDKEIGL